MHRGKRELTASATALLVHGAFHGAWCWERVIPLLDERRIPWKAIDLPTCSSKPAGPQTPVDDAAAVRAALDEIGGPTLVVGHSYGGFVITNGVAGHTNARHLLYLAAYMSDKGESLLDMMAFGPPRTELLEHLEREDDGRARLDRYAVDFLFYQDCDASTQEWAAANLRPMWTAADLPGWDVAWRVVPSTYVICADDHAVNPQVQRRLAERATRAIEWPTGHSPFASHPALVADLIAEIATSVMA